MVEPLRPYLSAGHAEYLSDLLEGKDVPGKIQFKGSTKQLGEFFKRMLYNQKLLNNLKDDVENWICRNFLYRNSKIGPFQELKKTVSITLFQRVTLNLKLQKESLHPGWYTKFTLN